MRYRAITILTIALIAGGLAACTSPEPQASTIPTQSDAASPSASETPEAAAGTRTNPLPVGQTLKLSTDSMWSVGAEAATTVADGYVVLPLRIDMDWDAAAAQGVDVDNEGADPWANLTWEYVASSGRSYTTWDNYDIPIDNAITDIGTVYPPTETLSASIPLSVPNEDIPGGAWKISNTRGDSVFIIGAP